MKTPIFTGSCTAMISPFTRDGIDYGRMGALLDFQEENGTEAVLIAATTGENATLESHEYEALVAFCIKHISGRMHVMVGVGGNDTRSCLKKAQWAESAGADSIIMTTPYYNKSTQEGIYQHFVTVADQINIPLVLYNIPARTGIGITYNTYYRLSEHPNINGVKEASGDFSLIAQLLTTCKGTLNVWSGNDDQTLPMMALGACGVISVASNIVPKTVAKICRLCQRGSYTEAAAIYAQYANLFSALFIETNPIPVKAAMKLLELDSGILRLPLVSITEEHLEQLKMELRRIQLLK